MQQNSMTDPVHSSHAAPSLECDIVMKGGITSGVTYPWAVCEIATTYRLRGIGGSSAGAIAAAAAAAAELGRGSTNGGFSRLATLPDVLRATDPRSRRSFMFGLFQPAATTRPFFDMVTAALDAKGHPLRRVLMISFSAASSFPIRALLGALPGLSVLALLAAWIFSTYSAQPTPLGVAVAVSCAIAGIIITVIGIIVALAWKVTSRAMKVLPANGFGVCNGMSRPDRQNHPALTSWLADELDRIAGREPTGPPLTVGDLAEAGIQLKMLTTNLTDGSPYTLPFHDQERFFFDPAEFYDLFPARIVDWMTSRIQRSQGPHHDELLERMRPLVQFPLGRDLPVIVATRMSLSFPLLISAVPLYTADWTHPGAPPIRCWFSDGGITSNFPVHLFERPVPMWPTFFINLGRTQPGERLSEDERQNVWTMKRHSSEGLMRWTDISGIPNFVKAILDTMQNYLDNAQARMVGFQDRVVLIKHTDEEGGMNLNMGSEAILALSNRGRYAGRLLVERFSRPAGEAGEAEMLSWEDNRWVRYRNTMAITEALLKQIVQGFRQEEHVWGTRSLIELIGRGPQEPPDGWRWHSPAQKEFAEKATKDLMELVHLWIDSGQSFEESAPLPRPQLRMIPDF